MSLAKLREYTRLHDPLILTMQGFGQHEPLVGLNLHVDSFAGIDISGLKTGG